MLFLKKLGEEEKQKLGDKRLEKTMDEIQAWLQKDQDCIGIVDGSPGLGKSTLAQQLANRVDPTFKTAIPPRICMDMPTLQKTILEAKPGSAIIFDEALNGLNIRRTMSSLNVILTSLMAECRQKRLFIVLCLPSIFDMDRSIAIHRALFLIHVYTKGGTQRYFKFFGKKQKSKLFQDVNAKRIYQYKARPTFYGKFFKGYVVDEVAYRKLKADALKKFAPLENNAEALTPEERIKQREAEIYKLLADNGVKTTKLDKWGIVGRETARKLIKKYESSHPNSTSINKEQQGDVEIFDKEEED